MMNFINNIKKLCSQAIQQNYGQQLSQLSVEQLMELIEVTPATSKQFGHYQCNSAMKLTKLLQKPPRKIAEELQTSLLALDQQVANPNMFSNIEIAGPGFINFTLHNNYLEQCINAQLHDPRQGVAATTAPQKIIVDFSSPNIAKEMHVGHLRSTIIGDCLARILSFIGHNVLRLNHLGDWGTQFGMLIAYLKQHFADPSHTNLNLSELLTCYRSAKQQFDEDPDFKATAQQEVVKLQNGDRLAKEIWQEICHISSVAYQEIYSLLDITIIDRGESFYNEMLPEVIKQLEQANLVQVSDGAKCIYLDGFINRHGEPLPLIIQKADGGFNYATTDLAAIWHRTKVEQADWIIYVVDSGQAQHLAMVFAAAQQAKFFNAKPAKLDHVAFGLVLGQDGKKFRTRSGDTERLMDLLTTAIAKAKQLLLQRDPNIDPLELQKLAKQLGINAIKYADLANNRINDYVFSYDKMLQFEGNTAAFLSYAYVRIQSIKRKVGIDIATITEKISLTDPYEVDLALHICQFSDCLQATVKELLPNRLTDYIYRLSEKFHAFFHQCRVEGSPQQNSRLLLCEATTQVLARGFALLGLTPMEKM